MYALFIMYAEWVRICVEKIVCNHAVKDYIIIWTNEGADLRLFKCTSFWYFLTVDGLNYAIFLKFF